MQINFLVGSLILREKKTGVHLYYENIIKKFIEDKFFNIRISVYESSFSLKKRYSDIPYKGLLNCSFKLARLFIYFLPIEWFFCKSDVYICDGVIPITLFKSKKIAVIHVLMVYIYPGNYNLIKKFYLRYYFYQVKKRADYVIAVSATTQNDIIRYLGIPKSKIGIVYNGVTFNDEQELTQLQKIDFGNKYLLYIGDLRKNKNIISAIKSFEICMRRDQNLYFYIAGHKSNEYLNLNQYVKDHGLENRVKFLGYVSEAEKIYLYKKAFAFIFVSGYEGFGVPIIEAMHYGIPVITSNRSSMKEISGDGAILVSPDNIEEIANAIQLLENKDCYEEYVAKGYHIAEKYTWNNSYEQMKQLLKDVIN